jgi:hypothetical protein
MVWANVFRFQIIFAVAWAAWCLAKRLAAKGGKMCGRIPAVGLSSRDVDA